MTGKPTSGGFEKTPGWLDWYAGPSKPQFKLPPGKYRARDGAHFNAEGYRIVVARMLPQVEALIAAVRPRR